jgi:hypothetical protein
MVNSMKQCAKLALDGSAMLQLQRFPSVGDRYPPGPLEG